MGLFLEVNVNEHTCSILVLMLIKIQSSSLQRVHSPVTYRALKQLDRYAYGLHTRTLE